jgi:hypothetical protein
MCSSSDDSEASSSFGGSGEDFYPTMLVPSIYRMKLNS